MGKYNALNLSDRKNNFYVDDDYFIFGTMLHRRRLCLGWKLYPLSLDIMWIIMRLWQCVSFHETRRTKMIYWSSESSQQMNRSKDSEINDPGIFKNLSYYIFQNKLKNKLKNKIFSFSMYSTKSFKSIFWDLDSLTFCKDSVHSLFSNILKLNHPTDEERGILAVKKHVLISWFTHIFKDSAHSLLLTFWN